MLASDGLAPIQNGAEYLVVFEGYEDKPEWTQIADMCVSSCYRACIFSLLCRRGTCEELQMEYHRLNHLVLRGEYVLEMSDMSGTRIVGTVSVSGSKVDSASDNGHDQDQGTPEQMEEDHQLSLEHELLQSLNQPKSHEQRAAQDEVHGTLSSVIDLFSF